MDLAKICISKWSNEQLSTLWTTGPNTGHPSSSFVMMASNERSILEDFVWEFTLSMNILQ